MSYKFQSTPLREGRQTVHEKPGISAEFQSTPLREGRQDICQFMLSMLSFNPRPCVRGDLRLEYSTR